MAYILLQLKQIGVVPAVGEAVDTVLGEPVARLSFPVPRFGSAKDGEDGMTGTGRLSQ